MKTLVGKVVNIEVGVPIKKRTGGSYEGWRLTYQDADGKVEQIAKPIQGLNFQPSLKKAVSEITAGDDITIEIEKGESGFWEVISIAKGTNVPAQREAPVMSAKPKYKTDRTERSDEVQRMIVRQSSLAQAVAHLGTKAARDDILEEAASFEAWVMRKDEAEVD